MIFICVKFPVKPEYADQWPELTKDFTDNTRAEPGNIFYDWSRSVEDSERVRADRGVPGGRRRGARHQ